MLVADYAKKTYSHLEKVNPKDYPIEEKNARFFIIKSYTEDDVHKSMKYQVWSSTNEGNKRLNGAYKKCVAEKAPLFLFFSVNASGQFVGMCKMCSEVTFGEKLGHWSQYEKWPGKFKVEWIFIKDVPNKQLKSILVPTNEFKPVTNSRDTQEIPYSEAMKTVKIFQDYVHESSLLDEFETYDSEEKKHSEEKPTQESFGKFTRDPANKGQHYRGRGKAKQEYSKEEKGKGKGKTTASVPLASELLPPAPTAPVVPITNQSSSINA